MAITWPLDKLPIHDVMFARRNLSRSGGLTLSGIEQVVQSSSDFWEAIIGLKIRRPTAILQFRSMMAQSMGRATEWIVPVCSQFGFPPPGFSDGFSGGFATPVVATAAGSALMGATSMGMAVSMTPSPGQYFSIGNHLHVIATVSGIASPYTVTFAPKLRVSISSGTSIEFDQPKCLMRLAQDSSGQMNLDMLRFSDVTLNFVEVPI